MKDFRQANKGASFEGFIEYANAAYRRDGKAIIEKQNVKILPIRDGRGKIITCKIGEKSTVDYIGRLGRYPIAIEAKHTESDAIRYHAVEDHQARFLRDYCYGGDGIGIVLVSFNLERYFAVPAPFWIAARNEWEKARRKNVRKANRVTIKAYGQEWTTNGKASVKPDELLPEWEVYRQYRYGLDYLANAKKYTAPPP